ncbi:purine-cytosine permease-like protein [Kibdelosporangium banguiense]|uniref:Purine-cytosine permease-like protein n=1 Tax=Kibdelosporangium banguiense TaxID=1365924 RepID=A0ABS4TEZ8_9PSEU|nr:cytosine permease [Kibdelosporangium banguiense]MBP2322978.1 purine-cytosine permease-like protein [Kibdelosporangium banguiense]
MAYGEKVVKVEPGGIEPVAAQDKHGRPIQLFWTWTSPNLEFATIFLGVLAVSAFGLSFWQAAAALTLGNLLGSIAHGFLSARGPVHGVPQMVLGRVAFGYWGNLLPASLMSIMAGAGWFAVNSVSGAFALNSLTGLPVLLCLVLIVAVQILIAFFGHNLVQAFERYVFPVLAVVFLVTAIFIFARSALSGIGGAGGLGGFLLTASAAFGYTAGWNPYAADYTRYLPAGTSRRAVGWFAGSGLFLATTVLMLVGAASVTVGGNASSNPATTFTNNLPPWLAALTLLAIALGAVAANVLNVYSAALAFLTLGINLPLAWRRAVVAACFGAIGFVLAWLGLSDAGHAYESFLLVIAYWIGPWLGVVLVDMHVRRGQVIDSALTDTRHRNWAGPVAMLAGMLISIGLFSNQSLYTGPIPQAVPWIGDITFLVGFVIAAGIYAVWPKTPVRAG